MTNKPEKTPIAPPELPLGEPRAGDIEMDASGVQGVEFLERAVPGDPVGVRFQVARRLRERCLLLDPHGISIQVLASMASGQQASLSEADREQLEVFDSATRHLVESTVDRVIDDCVSGRLEVPLAGLPRGGVLMQLSRVLEVSQVELKRACDRFNRLPAEARRAFHALILQRRSLESACRRSASVAENWSLGAARGLQEIVGARAEGSGRAGTVMEPPAQGAGQPALLARGPA